MKRLLVLLLALSAALVPAPAKDKPGKGKGRGQDSQQVRGFIPADRATIVEYFRAGPSGLPPGLAKRGGDLPPGLEKQMRRNGTLPPGLQRRLAPFPPQLETRLAPCPAGVRRSIFGHLAVMWDARTRVVLDIVAFGP